MPIDLVLEERVSDKHWKATGTFKSQDGKFTADGTVLLEQTGETELKLILDASKVVSQIGGREILTYVNAQPEKVEQVQKGEKITITKFWVNLKKIK